MEFEELEKELEDVLLIFKLYGYSIAKKSGDIQIIEIIKQGTTFAYVYYSFMDETFNFSLFVADDIEDIEESTIEEFKKKLIDLLGGI